MPVWFTGSSHVLASQSAGHNGVIVMLDAATTEFNVVKAGSISSLFCNDQHLPKHDASTSTYHPDIRTSFKFSVNAVTSKVGINFQAGCGSQFSVWLETNGNDNVVRLDLRFKNNIVRVSV